MHSPRPRFALLLPLACFGAALTTSAAPLPPDANLVEAETATRAADCLRQDASARGGSYATNPRAWNPVVKLKVPADLATATIWARLRGGPFQLKGTPGGKQTEYSWSKGKPATWTWYSFGTYDRAKLGDTLLLIRGANLAEDGGIDAVLLSPDPAFDPATLDEASPSAAQGSATGPKPSSPPSAITVPSDGWFPKGWVSRRTLFRENLAADQGAVVFVGDSITQGFKLEAAFPGLKTANRGIGGDLVANLRHRLDDVTDLDPKAVVLLMGTNDAKDGKAPAKIVADLRAAAEKIHDARPSTPLIVCRLLPRAPKAGDEKEAGRLPGAILEVNKLIDALPSELPWLHVADTFTPLAQADGLPVAEYFGDGVHPNAAGYAALQAVLVPALRSAGVVN